MVDEQARGLHGGGDVGELVRDGLELAQRAAERLARGDVGDGRVERRLRHAHRERADAGAKEVERPHGDREALVDLAEDVVARHGHAVEDQPPDRMRESSDSGSPPRPSLARGTANAVRPRSLVRANTE